MKNAENSISEELDLKILAFAAVASSVLASCSRDEFQPFTNTRLD